MSTQTLLIMQAVGVIGIVVILIGLLFYQIGERRGRAKGWLERYFAEVEKDRRRRDQLGRFRHVERGQS